LEFLTSNYVLKLTVFQEDKPDWREKALEILDEHEMKQSLENDATKCNIIGFNSITGKHLKNLDLQHSNETHNVLLFLISMQTPTLGKLIKNHFHCDFLLTKFEIPYDTFKSDVV